MRVGEMGAGHADHVEFAALDRVAGGGDVLDAGGVKGRHARLGPHLPGEVEMGRRAFAHAGDDPAQRLVGVDVAANHVEEVDQARLRQPPRDRKALFTAEAALPVLVADEPGADEEIGADAAARRLEHRHAGPQVEIHQIDRDLLVWQRGNDVARRLMTIPGIGPVGAAALAASVTDPHQFHSGRQFAAWLGLTPLQKSSGGKERLGRISKMGDKYLRKLLIVGMTSLVRRAKYNPHAIDPRLANLLARKPVRVATVAMANKTARTIWAIMTRGETYRAGHQPALAA